jgi:acyl carrier protein
MDVKEKIENLILGAIIELNEEIKKDELNSPTQETKLYGGNAALDSLALVSLIIDIEERISDELDIDIVLADEKAMSQRTSPFRTVETLRNYIEKLINKE